MGHQRQNRTQTARPNDKNTGKKGRFTPWLGRLAGRAFVAATMAMASMSPGAAQTQLTPTDFARVNALSGNTVAWAVLRKAVELGLAEAGLADIASRSDSVDTVAAILALEDPEGRLVPILSGAARGGQMAASNAALVASLGLDGDRPRGLACLVYGKAPQDRELLAELVALSSAGRANCARHYGRIRDYWLAAVTGFLRAPSAREDALVDVELDPASGTLASARSILIAGETVHEIVYFLRRAVRYPRPLVMRGTSCGVPMVGIDPDSGQLVVCYELLAELVPPIAASIGNQAR
ncbi:hypothetical protein MNBD_ALPHA09-3 [hydrothermal vent metagenome]|uniref:Uncharacterized protein n=1 Tax=hydrothermal vent metagenome TaxID=652676 RepID=A0A3B0T2H0_9ZZZZ